MLLFSDLALGEGGELVQNNASLFLHGDMINEAGIGYLAGNIFADEGDVSTALDGINRVSRDTDIYADYTNAGTTIIQRGILYIYGDLVNNGTLTGEYNNGLAGGSAPEPGDGFSIGGSYTVGQGATLSMPNPVWWLRVGSHLDIAIDDPSHFAMSEATIELNGLAPGKVQTLETLGADLGADESGFDPLNFPIGTLRVTSDSTTQLVNNHVNTVDAPCEVLYVDELVVSAGGTLMTNGCPIYARSATINGTVDEPGNIIIVKNGCVGDLDGNGFVNGVDLAYVLGAWGTDDPAADLDHNGIVSGADLALLLGAWGPCP
jgi:hypothetical protein